MNTPLVTVQWLHDHLNDPGLIILDAVLKDGSSELENIRIPGARAFDIKNKFSDVSGAFPNTFPWKEKFEQGCRELGISSNSKIVVYDQKGIYSGPRVWWMFKTFGHEKVWVLDGGLPEWIKQGYGTEENNHTLTFEPGDFKANMNENQVKTIDFMRSNLENPKHHVLDARSASRFNGEETETRKGLRSGHIPNSVNVPYSTLLKDGKFKSKEELKDIFHAQINDHEPITFTCGSGITACILLLGASMVLDNETSVYDGSWTEWGTLENR